MRGAKALAVVVLLVAATAVWAADQGTDFNGTITLRGGKTLTGQIQLAELGVVEGAGIGTSLPNHGSIYVKVGDETQRVAGDDIASVVVDWVNSGTKADPRWEIKKLTVTKKDGTKVEGPPDWLLHATNVAVVPAGGKTVRINVFPFGGEPFSSDDLIARIDMSGATAPAAPAAPAPTTPAAPAPTTPAAPAPTTPAAPAPTTPAAPAPTTPSTPAAPAPTTPAAPAPTTPAAPAAPAAHGATTPAAAIVATPGAVVGQGTYTFLVKCPKCGQWIQITITASAVTVQHVEAAPAK